LLTRNLVNIPRELTVLEQRGKVTGFLENTEGMDKLGDLLDDIREAMMDYQVSPEFPLLPYLTSSPDVLATRHLR